MNNEQNSNNIKYYQLSHPQKRIWYTEKIYPHTSLYNIGGTIRIKGSIEFRILEEAINFFIKSNEGLRLEFVEQNGEVYQYVREYKRINIDVKDFTVYKEPQDEFEKWIEEVAKKPFSLKNERLFNFELFKISDNENGYLAKFHHIISDGWSMNIMTEQICDIYMKLLNQGKIDNNPGQSYIEYIDNEKKYLSSDRFFKNKVFWTKKFNRISTISLNKSSDIIKGRRRSYELGLELSLKIKAFARDNKCSLNTFFVTLYLLYINKTTQQDDIVIGTPVLNRSGKKEKAMFGMFTSTMPFRFIINDGITVSETMEKVNAELINCYFNQKYPYDLLIQDLGLKEKGCDSLFNVCVNYFNTKLNSEINGLSIDNVEFYNGNQIYSLQLVIKDWSDSGNLVLDFDYKIYDYSDEQIDDMYSRLAYLINQIIKKPNDKIGKLSLLFENEIKKLLYEFNNSEMEYPKDKTICQLFEEQVERTPDKVAISFNQFQLNYRELNERANQLARYLVEKGVQGETIIGLLTTHSIETVIGILSILKAGGAYLPIDPSYPNDRINYMLKDSNAAMLLTNFEKPDGVSFNGKTINLNKKSLYVGEASNLQASNKTNDLVYVIYTSGSTGEPKGTMIEHQGLVNYIWWAKKIYVKNKEEVFPLYSSLAFDLTITSIFTPLISGSKIIVYGDCTDEDEYVLYRIMKENKATVVKLTPAHLDLLKGMDNRSSSVQRFIVGGEDLKVSIAKDIYESFGGNIEIFNEYGPTETVVGCMIHKYDYKNDTQVSVPIGMPADNVQIYILDRNLNPVSLNTVGEIYISGDGVARGYLNRLELTYEKFIDNPFINGKRMYKTGDLARFIGDSKIEYIGRIDQQVKIRGYRIELGEIEKNIINHEAIKNAVVVDLEDKNKNKYLCAYIVKKTEVSDHDLKSFLLRYIPDYMIPLYFIEIEEIPLTVNGKVDRALLPKSGLKSIDNIDLISYRNEKEEILVNAISESLSIERVGVNQNFYRLGGDSIKAIQIASKLGEKGFKIKVKEILSHPIIEEMALCVECNKGLKISQDICEGSIKHAPIVSWFFSRNFANRNYYNQSVLFELKQYTATEKLEIILNELIRHHDSLRANYNPKTSELYYNNEHLNRHYSIQEHDLTDLTYSMQIDRMTFIAETLKASFDIENSILIKACAFNLGQFGRKLLITAHHLVIDGISWRIILDDINIMLKQINNRQQIDLPAKTHSFQKWVYMLEDYGRRELGEEKKYWESILSKNFSFPIDYDLGPDTINNSNTLSVQISKDDTECLMSKANFPYGTETKDLLITALLRTIKQFTGNEDIIIELEGHGREDMFEDLDISRTVGWFTNLYPFYIGFKSNDYSFQIKEVKEEIRKIPNKGIGFGILKYLLKDLYSNSQKNIRFNYLGEFTTESSNNAVDLLSDQFGKDIGSENELTCSIDINCFIANSKLSILLTYSRNKFSENTMREFINNFSNDLKTIISYCCDKKSVEYTPSDFDTVDLTQEELESFFN